MKIAFITCHFPPDSIGGGQVQSYRLCLALGRKNAVTVYTRDYTGLLPKSERKNTFLIVRRNVSIIPLMRSVIDLSKSLRFIRKNRQKYDLFISFHIQLAALIVVLSKMMFGVIAVVSPRGFEDFDFSTLFKRVFLKFIYRHCSVILIQSEKICKHFIEELEKVMRPQEVNVMRQRILILPNLIETGSLLKPKATPFQIIYVGRLIDYKGVEYLITAAKMLSFEYRLLLLGDGPDRGRLETMSEGMPIQFAGEISFENVEGYLSESHVLILPSLTENLPNVVLEALALKIPVIATRVGAVPEVIKEGHNGYLVDPKNAGQIAEKIELLYKNADLYKQISENACQSIKRFTPKELLPVFQTKLEKIIKNHASTS